MAPAAFNFRHQFQAPFNFASEMGFRFQSFRFLKLRVPEFFGSESFMFHIFFIAEALGCVSFYLLGVTKVFLYSTIRVQKLYVLQASCSYSFMFLKLRVHKALYSRGCSSTNLKFQKRLAKQTCSSRNFWFPKVFPTERSGSRSFMFVELDVPEDSFPET